jgi:hypothetical protein
MTDVSVLSKLDCLSDVDMVWFAIGSGEGREGNRDGCGG